MGQRKAKLGRVSDVDLRLLRIFQAVVTCGGLSAAEVELGIGRSTVSTHLSDLEARLGARLCKRGRSGFALTEHGMAVYEASLSLMDSLENFRNEVNRIHGLVSGELKVGMVDNVVWDKESGLDRVFAEFSRIGEDVELMLYILSPDEIERRLIDGSLHVGISPVMRKLPSLDYQFLFDETSYLYCGVQHPFFSRDDADITEAELMAAAYVKKGYTVSDVLQEVNERNGAKAVAYHVESIALLITSGCYIGFLPEQYAANWERQGEMRRLFPGRHRGVFSFNALTHRDRKEAPAQEAFLTLLAQVSGGHLQS